MTDEHLPDVHVQIFAVGGDNTEVALCHDSLDVNTELNQDRDAVIGPNAVLTLLNIGDPASALECFHHDLGILTRKSVRGNG